MPLLTRVVEPLFLTACPITGFAAELISWDVPL